VAVDNEQRIFDVDDGDVLETDENHQPPVSGRTTLLRVSGLHQIAAHRIPEIIVCDHLAEIVRVADIGPAERGESDGVAR
jgi:hypothetical protein